MYLYPTAAAAKMLGLTPETLRSWRRRGMGPTYIKQRGGNIRSRGRGKGIKLPSGATMNVFAGERHWSDAKPNGTILYPEDALAAFVASRTVPSGRVPRPFPGRLSGGRTRTAADRDATGRTDGGGRDQRPSPFAEGPLLAPASAASFLGVATETLRGWRRRGIGAAHIRLPGGLVRYVGTDLIDFAVLLETQRTRLGSIRQARASPARAAAGKPEPSPRLHLCGRGSTEDA
ncbi:MAG TPA: hypothetical protein VME47_22005 [Acetobacteraceae bacterium]|nr:hypothetical protein [Acetobacteraceae bacterium]